LLQLESFTDVSDILSAGVYALVKRGVVIYVGKSKSLYQRIYAHRHTAARAAKGKPIPSWLPIKGFVFDQIFVRTCRLEDLDSLEAQMIETYKPRYNESLKSHIKVTVPVTLKIGAVAIAMNTRPTSEAVRRI
jgi:excinuclease UvrABC nuclease subunit